MNHLKPDKTDEFFRQALNSAPDLSPSEKDWKDMERLLKAKPGQKPVLARLYWPAGIAAALLIFFSLWLSEDKQTPADQLAKSKVPAKKTETNRTETDKKNDDLIMPEVNEKRKALQAEAGSSKKSKNLTLDNNPIVNTNDLLLQKQSALSSAEPKQSLAVNSTDNHGANTANEITLNTDPQNSAAQLKQNENRSSDSITAEKKPAVQTPNGKWALSIAFSPDMNSVKEFSKSSLGMSIGMGLSYKITKSVSASTGLYYSQKQYTSDKTSYKVTEKPFATWTSYSKQIDADCRVIDIPVNLNMVMMSNKNVSILASAGISSYIMLSETYNFIYNSGHREYTLRNENQHVLSVVNLSVGLEKPINQQSSIVIQPYAKLPLTGIGQGKTDLKSFGIGFQLNYSLKKKNKFFRSAP